MKHYTTISQSKKLLSLGLSPESADMAWIDRPSRVTDCPDVPVIMDIELESMIPQNKLIPCWSVGALLELILTIKSSKSFHLSIEDGVYCMCYNDFSNGDYEEFVGSTPLEAAYNTVYWLLENNYIKTEK